MTDEKLIADQAREIASLKEVVSEYEAGTSDIIRMLVCVGGPLNDNKLEFNPEQLKFIQGICDVLEGS